MRAEREKRAAVLQSEGQRASAINVSEGQRESQINRAEGEKQQLIKEAEGRGAAIRTVAEATAAGIRAIAESIQAPGGLEAVQYRVATDYISQFGNLAREANTLILPSNFSDIGGMIAAAMTVIKHGNGGPLSGVAGGNPRPAAPAPSATTASLTPPASGGPARG
jgi:regulator of protease activity HflC (stomatin/prohibitin superfamily)